MSKNGPHQLALRRRSVKVLLGAKKTFRMRAGSESGAVSAGGIDAGGTGMAAMDRPPRELRAWILARSPHTKQALAIVWRRLRPQNRARKGDLRRSRQKTTR